MTQPYQRPQTNGLAIGSLICGLLGFSCLTAIPAVIMGHIALGQIKREPQKFTGSGMAIAGLVFGYFFLVVSFAAVPAGMLLPVLSKAREKARRVNCSGNLKQIGLACLMHSGENQGAYPDDLAVLAENQVLNPGKVYACPSSETFDVPMSAADIRAGKCGYDYFGKGIFDDDPRATQLVIAADKPGNHPGGQWINALFADGHVEGCPAATIEEAAQRKGWLVPGINTPVNPQGQ